MSSVGCCPIFTGISAVFISTAVESNTRVFGKRNSAETFLKLHQLGAWLVTSTVSNFCAAFKVQFRFHLPGQEVLCAPLQAEPEALPLGSRGKSVHRSQHRPRRHSLEFLKKDMLISREPNSHVTVTRILLACVSTDWPLALS